MDSGIHPQIGHRWFAWLLLAVAGLAACDKPAQPRPPQTWVAYYGTDAPPELLQGFDVAVVDPSYAGDLAIVKAKRTMALGYLSLGELNDQRPQFAPARDQGLLLRENPNWKGAWFADIRKPGWQRLVIDEMADAILARGFDGLFLDTLDSALHLEATDPKQFQGMTDAAVAMLLHLHRRHPAARLLVNGAVPLAGRVAPAVQWFAVESSLTDWDFTTKKARWRTDDERQWAAGRLAKARIDQPNLLIFTLDYWDAADRDGVRAIYRKQREAGLVPYVATIELDRIVPEPGAATASALRSAAP
ncbi:MAG: endo alpha-1,4 polygalactosaminidase [Deltaproteobacteria bacterium]|nr:endo alpha-1,4 polygalactosaminidase [Deltaproteobacteria bacterium]